MRMDLTTDLNQIGAAEAARRIADGALSPVALLDACLARIARVQPALNAFTAVFTDTARAQAVAAEHAVAAGKPLGLLHGVPVAIKDFTPMAGVVSTRGSYALKNWVPDHDPVIVQRLRNAGAIIVGRTTTPEYAHSSFTRSPLWGETLNPWDARRTSGGSSGGSAVAVATGCVPLAEGTDMGGSVRIPAALCGVAGLKPSLGRIPMDILPTTFDLISHFGPIARRIEDIARFVEVTQGPDDADILSQMRPTPLGDCLAGRVYGLRIALSVDLGFYHVDPDVEANLLEVADTLRAAGAIVDEIDLDWKVEVVDAWNANWGVFLAAAAGRHLPEFADRMDPALLRVIHAGQKMGAVALKQLEEVRTRQWRSLAMVFRNYDVLLCPTTAVTAPFISAQDADFEHADADGRLRGMDMCAPFNNIAQCPALSVPAGLAADGMPTAVQIVGRRYDDPTVLAVGAAIERLRPFVRCPHLASAV
jgi:Asp-tRNA(Asn)/Glu-tRNA(Gln) amidotransferase A subunit family amidase